MRILQLIDSLAVGGAERMAVNYANALSQKMPFSGLVATRKEGSLKSDLLTDVNYLFLDKKKTIDTSAIFRLKSYCKKNKVSMIHAHGTTFFTAFLLKIVLPKMKIIWHDHNGARNTQTKTQNLILLLCSQLFSGIIVVNHKLENWVREHLGSQNVLYLPNFTTLPDFRDKQTELYGNSGKRILYLANLRYPKNHIMLLAVALKLRERHPDWSFHLVGEDKHDDYAHQIKTFIATHSLTETVYIYGQKTDSGHIISQSDIAVITSSYEGLPVSLLEYGIHGKAVVATNVGEIPMVIDNGKNGFVVEVELEAFYNALVKLIEDVPLRSQFGEALSQTIAEKHSQEAVLRHYLKWLETIL